MGVDARARVAGEVFAAAQDTGGAHGVVECAGFCYDFFRGGAVASAAEGVIGFVVQADV